MTRQRTRRVIVVFATVASFLMLGQTVLAATPVPPQCIMNLSGIGGSSSSGANGAVACNLTGDTTNFQNGKCYTLNQVPATEIDCTKPPINNLWRFKCEGSETVFQSYIVPDPNDPRTTDPNNDPVASCTAAGATYKAAGLETATPTAPNQNGTPSKPSTPTAPSGSGATTTAEKTTLPEGSLNDYKTVAADGKYYCGSDQGKEVHLSIDLGCVHKDPAILDLMFAIIRLLSIGVGIVVIGSIVFAGIQYIWSRGNPQEVAKAQERIRSAVIALVIFIFIYAILNWLVPAGVLK